MGRGLAVGLVVRDLARSPAAVDRPPVELVSRDARKSVDDVVVAGAEAVEQSVRSMDPAYAPGGRGV
jgi:cytosine/adenosine deaminase-related metal-dependent hydrolase